jgi:1-aminocyclopropane-1-carboxylate deaminase/D-cysteine desulfhydrase-like pyridoxal-dependent ACC family enzyme
MMQQKLTGVVTGCGVDSPQGAIVATIARYFNIPSIVIVGGTKEDSIPKKKMLVLARNLGAKIEIMSLGYHTILYKRAKDIQAQTGYTIVDYGINLKNDVDAIINSTSKQVQNIPDTLDNLIVTCGSGLTIGGILLGLYLYKKKVKNIYVVNVAMYDREEKILQTLDFLTSPYGPYYNVSELRDMKFNYVNLFSLGWFQHKSREKQMIADVVLHPLYEAKTYKWCLENNICLKNSCFWNIGVEPTF